MYSSLNQFAALGIVDFIRSVDWLNIAFIVVGAIVFSWIGRRLVDHFIKQFTKHHTYGSEKERKQRYDTLVAVFTAVVTTLISVIAFAMVLVQLGVDLAAATASIGALGVVLGIAGQSLFKSLFRGLMVIMGNQMRIGDIVAVSGVSGTVEDLSLLNTRLRDLDGTLHIIPNGEIIVLTNYSMGSANVNLDVRVGYDSDIDKVIKVINRIGEQIAKEDEWKDFFTDPVTFLRVDSFGESGVNIKALGSVTPGMQWGIAGEFRKRLLAEFSREGIEIPLPQRVVYSKEAKDAPRKVSSK